MKALITGFALAACSSAYAIPEAEEIPPEKIVKTWTLTVTLSGYDEKLEMTKANAVSVIEGFRTGEACNDEAGKLAGQLMSSLKKTGGKWDNAEVSFGCHGADSYLP